MTLTEAENVDRVRQVVPMADRVDRTRVVYLLARYMTEVGVKSEDEIRAAFAALAWCSESKKVLESD